MKNKIWLQRVLVLGLVIGSCFVIDIHSIERGKRPRSKSSESGRSSRAKEAAATAAATPTPIPTPEMPSAPPVETATATGKLSSSELESIVREILLSPTWTQEINAKAEKYEKHFSEEQRNAISIAYKEKQRIQQLERTVMRLSQRIGLQSRPMLPGGMPPIGGQIVAQPRTGYFESLFDYEGLLAKMLPDEWTTGKVAAAMATTIGATAAAILNWPLVSGYLTGMAALKLGAMYYGLGRALDCYQKGACTIDRAIEIAKNPIEQKLGDSAFYPTFKAQLDALVENDFINIDKDQKIFQLALARLKDDIEEKQRQIFAKNPTEKKIQDEIDDIIKKIREYYQASGILDDWEEYVIMLEEHYPLILTYQAVISEYLRTKEKIAQMKVMQKTPQPEATPSGTPSAASSSTLATAGQSTTSGTQQTPPPTSGAAPTPVEQSAGAQQSSSWIPSLWYSNK